MRLFPLLLLLPAACSGIRISTDFEGGSAQLLSAAGTEFTLRVEGQADQDRRNRQVSWYSFRVDGAKGVPLRIHLTDLKGEYDYKPGAICITSATPPLVSTDGKSWRHHPISGNTAEGTALLELTPSADPVWVAHLEPYVASRLELFRGEILPNPLLREEEIGRSVEGLPLRLWTITNPALPDAAKKVVWLMARQHAWESGTSFVAESAVRWLLSPEAAGVRDRVLFKILPMMDPDGCARGGVRFNRHGYDVNRNWDSVDPGKPEHVRLMPEIAAAKRVFLEWSKSGKPTHLFLTLHNQEEGEWLSGSAKHGALAQRFFDGLAKETTFSLEKQKGPRAPGARPAPGRFTVYQYLDLELGWPAFLLEQGIAKSERLGRLPVADDRRVFGAALARVMARIVSGD